LGGHHLILGDIRDYLTGETLVDTHDERYRQKLARVLVEDRGYQKKDLRPRVPVDLMVDGKNARIRLDLIVCIDAQVAMLVKYAPGSLTTRHQVALAASRLLAPYQVPFSVVTNGKEADILDNRAAAVVAEGLDGILSRRALVDFLGTHDKIPVAEHQRELAARILYAYEVDGRCPCDDTVCEYEQR
jgi:hypothetical protein